MIEQTDLVLDEWIYIPPPTLDSIDKITSDLTLEVMKKMASSKKGLACRFTCRFVNGKDPILLYIAQDSYVIDLEDKIDATEIRRMIANSYSKFKEKYEFKKLGTVLHNIPLNAFDENNLDISEILSLLNQT
jgi:hypothetical protein